MHCSGCRAGAKRGRHFPGLIASHLSWLLDEQQDTPDSHTPPAPPFFPTAAVPSPPMRHPSSSSYSGSLSPLLRPRDWKGDSIWVISVEKWWCCRRRSLIRWVAAGPRTQVHNTTHEIPHTYTMQDHYKPVQIKHSFQCKWPENCVLHSWLAGMQDSPFFQQISRFNIIFSNY